MRLLLFCIALVFFMPLSVGAQTCEATGSGVCLYAAPGAAGETCTYDLPCAFKTALQTSEFRTPGSVLYLRGGTYNSSDIRIFSTSDLEINSVAGTADDPITIKKYGTEIPVLSPEDCTNRDVVVSFSNDAYIILDGITIRPPNCTVPGVVPACEKHEGKLQQMIAVSNSSHMIFRNMELDGSVQEEIGEGIKTLGCDYITVERSYIHRVHRPTGNQTSSDGLDVGDGTCRAQSAGECAFFERTSNLIFQKNIVERCNHASVTVICRSGEYSRYNKIANNIVDARYGGGIYINGEGAQYNIVHGNIITHIGGTTTKTKGGIYISGSFNTIRKNVVFSPSGMGAGMECGPLLGVDHSPHDNLFYNNTIFASGEGSGPDPDHAGATGNLLLGTHVNGSPGVIEKNLFANNIFYLSSAGETIMGHGWEPEIIITLGNASEDSDWVGDEAGPWGGNRWSNNLIRKKAAEVGETDEDLITFMSNDGVALAYSMNDVQGDGTGAWVENIGDRPSFESEDPETYGVFDGWWALRGGSPCENKGIVVNDTLGAVGGWGALSAVGNPDIGAFEIGLDTLDDLNVGTEGDIDFEPGQGIPSDGISSVSGGCSISLVGNKFGFAGFVLLLLAGMMLLCLKKIRKR